MPDLVTHLSVGYLVRQGTKRIEQMVALFYLGTILPDVLTRPVNILQPRLYWLVMPLHTPLALTLVCLLLSYLFAETVRREVFLTLLFGVYLHLFLDLFQKSIGPAYPWLFPFSWRSFQIGLFWPEDSLVLLPVWGLLGILLVVKKLMSQRDLREQVQQYE